MTFRMSVAATKDDWINLFKKAKCEELLRFYVRYASRLDDMVPIRLEDIPNLGIAKTGILVQEDHYLALPTTEPVAPREIHLNSGGSRYCIDQLTNPDSFTFTPGGIWKNDCYVIGEMASLHTDSSSAKLANKIRRVMRKTFHPWGWYWIGPECREVYSHCTFTMDYRYPTTTVAS